MALPTTLNPASPAGTDSPGAGDDQIRALKQLIADAFGLPTDPTQITSPAFSITGAGNVTLSNGVLAVEDARTNSVDVNLELRSTTSGGPAAGIGTGLKFTAESQDENPSDFGELDFAASDIGTGTEDTYLDVLLRVGGAALATKYRLQSTGADKLVLTHAASAERTATFPNKSITVAGLDDVATIVTAAAVSGYGSIGQISKNNSGTPNTQFDLDADVVILRSTSDATIVRFNPGTAITNNILTAGPAADGRDQAGAFSSSSWLHFYWIWNGATLATLSSLVAPPTGPTLPTGYTHWSYAGAVRLNGSSELLHTWIAGSMAFHTLRRNVVSGGSATTEQSASLAEFVPPNALDVALEAQVVSISGSSGQLDTLNLRVVSGSDFAVLSSRAQQSSAINETQAYPVIPNIGQNLYWGFITSNQMTTHSANIWVLGYSLPNGGR